MRTQEELVKSSIERLDLIIKKLLEAKEVWGKEYDFLVSSSPSDERDQRLISLSQRIKSGSETAKLFVDEFSNDAKDLFDVVVKSETLFRSFGTVRAEEP